MRRGRVKERERKIGMNLWGGVREREREREKMIEFMSILRRRERYEEMWVNKERKYDEIWRSFKILKLWGEEETKSEGEKIGMNLWLLIIV